MTAGPGSTVVTSVVIVVAVVVYVRRHTLLRRNQTMDKINLGRVEVFFREGSPDPQPRSAPNRSGRLEPRTVTLEEAQQIAGWKVWQPAYLPFGDMKLDKVHITGTDAALDSVVLKYKRDSAHWLVIRQQLIRESSTVRRIPVPFPLRETVVNGHPAALFNHAVTATDLPGGQLGLLCCNWEHEDFLMELEAPYLSDQAAKQIAESLR